MRDALRQALRGAAALVALVPLAAPGCGERGAIMVAITTDLAVPKDVDAIGVTVRTDTTTRTSILRRLDAADAITLPATLAIPEADDPDAAIRVRVVGFRRGEAVVPRDVRTTAPHAGRVALLRVPLASVNRGLSVKGSLPAGLAEGAYDPFDPRQGLVASCRIDTTYLDGDGCQDAQVDSESLPDYAPALVHGEGARECFDARRCFAEAGEVADLDREACTLPLAGRDPARLNLALASDSAGVCLEAGRCVVPLDRGVSYVVDRGEVQLPRGVCKAIVATGKAKLLASVACAPKVITQPLCPD